MAKLLKESDLFVVQLQDPIHSGYKDDVVSVSFDTLKDSIVDLAIPGTPAGDYIDGEAGVVYPGAGFYYDQTSGRMDVAVESDLQFIGVITATDPTDADDSTASGITEFDPLYRSDGRALVPRGNFFVVGETNLILPENIWNLKDEGDRFPQLGDLVVCINDSVGPFNDTVSPHLNHQWNVIPNVTGGQAVLEVRAAAPEAPQMNVKNVYVEVDTEAPTGSNQRPVIRVRKAGFVPVPSDSVNGGYYVGGLIDEHDKHKLDQFDLNLYQGGFVKSIVLKDEKSTTDSLTLTYLANQLQPQYPHIVLSAFPAEKGQYGVVDLATDEHVLEAILADTNDSLLSPTGRTDEVVMTPQKTIDHFVPRLFNTLPNLEIAAQNPTP